MGKVRERTLQSKTINNQQRSKITYLSKTRQELKTQKGGNRSKRLLGVCDDREEKKGREGCGFYCILRRKSGKMSNGWAKEPIKEANTNA